MATPRYAQISLDETPWYHVVSRCVRRAYLCGADHITGQSYEHRRAWVEARIRQLSSIFTIDIAAYSVMSNHYHIVVRVDRERVADLSIQEVIQRWTQLYQGPFIIRRYLSEKRNEMSPGELLQVETLADEYRQRLCDLSWFMKNLNEFISRRANAEDDVKGHFWESRYKCQALLDEQALLAAMAYVDLNPVRAAMAETPEDSAHTSVKERINEVKSPSHATNTKMEAAASEESSTGLENIPPAPLLPFDPTSILQASIPFALDDYFELVDTVGRAVHPAKRGYIPEHSPAILTRLGIDVERFIAHSNQFIERFGNHVGSPARLIQLAAARNAHYLRGMAKSRELFGGTCSRVA
jgi:REP element-mobilizing transposase RayT